MIYFNENFFYQCMKQKMIDTTAFKKLYYLEKKNGYNFKMCQIKKTKQSKGVFNRIILKGVF